MMCHWCRAVIRQRPPAQRAHQDLQLDEGQGRLVFDPRDDGQGSAERAHWSAAIDAAEEGGRVVSGFVSFGQHARRDQLPRVHFHDGRAH
jgi:hypothetical protein